jgi:deazaflavin-dependent oxidoreductase (nitroreductase family)
MGIIEDGWRAGAAHIDNFTPFVCREPVKPRLHILFWRLINPPTRVLAGLVPWWVLIETRGRKTGLPRQTPLAAGPSDDAGMWLNAVHGRHADWVRNIEAQPAVRIRIDRTWRAATAEIKATDPDTARRFNFYARGGPLLMGVDPLQVYVRFEADD